MEFRHLRAFAAVVEHEHFGRAAESLHLAQPALSQQIRQLERELGTRLFDRTTRRVTITEAGLRLAPHARALLAGAQEAGADLALLTSGRAGRVSVGFVGTSTYDVLPRVALEVRADLPDVELELRGEMLSPALVDGLLDGTFDLALLRPGPRLPAGLTATTLRTERLVAALPRRHRLAHRRRIDLADLAGDGFVTHPSSGRSAIHATVLGACAAAGFVPDMVAETAETATLMVLVASGQGVALVPAPVRSLGVEGVAYVALTAAPTVDLALAHRTDRLSPAAARVAEVIERRLRPVPRPGRGGGHGQRSSRWTVPPRMASFSAADSSVVSRNSPSD